MSDKPKLAPQARTGPIEAVPCPWCGKENDFREVDHLIVAADLSQGAGDPGGGPVFACDHCNQNMRVVGQRVQKTISVRQAAKVD